MFQTDFMEPIKFALNLIKPLALSIQNETMKPIVGPTPIDSITISSTF